MGDRRLEVRLELVERRRRREVTLSRRHVCCGKSMLVLLVVQHRDSQLRALDIHNA